MPGGFAHITLVARVIDHVGDIAGLTNTDRRALTQHMAFVEIGAVAPDYPYLGLAGAAQNSWADRMHYEQTGDVIRNGVRILRNMPRGVGRDRALAWLLGYTAHVGMDLTIHPVVERRVGPYVENKTAHRTCEMHQDAFIWPERNLGDIGVADYFRQSITQCSDENGELSASVASLFRETLARTYPDSFAEVQPEIHLWHQGYRRIVDAVEETYRLFPAARHLLAAIGAGYPAPDAIDMSYIENLETPEGQLHYREIFDRATENVAALWSVVGDAVNAVEAPAAEQHLKSIPDADLDTGLLLAGEDYALWRTA